MKIYPECLSCGSRKTLQRIELSTNKPGLRLKCIRAFLKMMAEKFVPNACPSYLGTEQVNIIKRITRCQDPFKKIKDKQRKIAKKYLPIAKRYISKAKDQDGKFIKACKVSASANATEFMAPYKKFGIKEFRVSRFVIDDSKKLLAKAKKAKRILFLPDNHGEALFDLLFLRELRKVTNAKIIIGVSEVPIDDDLTLAEAKRFRFEKYGKLISTGKSFGIWWEKAPKRILNEIKGADLIIAKGLANYETLTERKLKNVAYLLTVKCEPVSKDLKVKIGSNVILLN